MRLINFIWSKRMCTLIIIDYFNDTIFDNQTSGATAAKD